MAKQMPRGKPFVKGDPRAGRPKGSRNKLSEDFFEALSADFAEHGEAAIKAMRDADPVAYVSTIGRLMPKELKVERPLGELSDAELAGLVDTVRTALEAAGLAVPAPAGAGQTAGRAALN